MRSHFVLSRGAALACAAAGAATTLPGVCHGQAAFDHAGDPAYDDGWQGDPMGARDNGGFGFGPWSFSFTYNTVVQSSLDTSSPHDQIRVPTENPATGPRAWVLFNPAGPEPGPEGMPTGTPNPPEGTDISQAGRAIPGGLQVGQTLSVVIDNPAERHFFRGYTVRLNTGGDNTTYQGTARSRLAIGTFEYFTDGKWYATGTGGDPTLFDSDTDGGMRIDVTLTGADTFNLVMTPLDDPGAAYSKSGTLVTAMGDPTGLPIDWIEFEMFGTDSDFFPAPAADPRLATDFYISSMTITPEPSAAMLLAAGLGSVFAARRRRPRAP